METKKYVIQDREARNIIEECDTLAEAQHILQQYEEEDKEEGMYTDDFYEIVEVKNE
jgi:hypothetical protein